MEMAIHDNAVETARPAKTMAQRMNDHVAYTLVIYTMNLIFMVAPAMETKGMSIFPYFSLIILVGLAIPFGRHYDHKWQNFGIYDDQPTDVKVRYRFDRIKLWVAAICFPLILTAILKMVFGNA